MSLYAYYRPPPWTIRRYRAWWGRPDAPEYREVTFDSDGRDVDVVGKRLLGCVPTGTEVVR